MNCKHIYKKARERRSLTAKAWCCNPVIVGDGIERKQFSNAACVSGDSPGGDRPVPWSSLQRFCHRCGQFVVSGSPVRYVRRDQHAVGRSRSTIFPAVSSQPARRLDLAADALCAGNVVQLPAAGVRTSRLLGGMCRIDNEYYQSQHHIAEHRY